MATTRAIYSNEATLEPAATEVIVKLVEHEAGKRGVAFGKACLEGRQVMLDELVEQRPFGSVPAV